MSEAFTEMELMLMQQSTHRLGEIQRLTARVAELEKDAARYRFMRDDQDDSDLLHMIASGSAHWDATVDAALSDADSGVDSASAKSIRSQIEGGGNGPEWQK